MGCQGSQTRADFITKLVDFDEWQGIEDVFKDLDSLWGPHTVDCSATYYKKNRQILFKIRRASMHLCSRGKPIEFLVGSAGLSYSQSSCLYVCSGSQGLTTKSY